MPFCFGIPLHTAIDVAIKLYSYMCTCMCTIKNNFQFHIAIYTLTIGLLLN